MKIEVSIDIRASYDDKITINIYDKISGTMFFEAVMTNEQFINATMNRLAHTPITSASLNHIERVGKKLELDTFVFEIPRNCDDEYAKTNVDILVRAIPGNWVAEKSFSSQNSFFSKDDKYYARTTIRRWVDE